MTEKACVDCLHYKITAGRDAPVCGRFSKPVPGAFDPVYGRKTNWAGPDCKVARSEGGQCGPSGRSWVSRHEELTRPTTIAPLIPAVRRRWWQIF